MAELYLIIIQVVVLLLFLWLYKLTIDLRKENKALNLKLNQWIAKLDLEIQLSDAFSHSKIQSESISNLAKDLFHFFKQELNSRAESYNDLIAEVKSSDLEPEVIELATSLFETILKIQYKEYQMTPEEQKSFRNKIKILAKRVEATQAK